MEVYRRTFLFFFTTDTVPQVDTLILKTMPFVSLLIQSQSHYHMRNISLFVLATVVRLKSITIHYSPKPIHMEVVFCFRFSLSSLYEHACLEEGRSSIRITSWSGQPMERSRGIKLCRPIQKPLCFHSSHRIPKAWSWSEQRPFFYQGAVQANFKFHPGEQALKETRLFETNGWKMQCMERGEATKETGIGFSWRRRWHSISMLL